MRRPAGYKEAAMRLPRATRVRLEMQLDALPVILAGMPAARLDRRPASGEWSARENLAHLARHADMFLARLERLAREDTPDLGTYRAERDTEWPSWAALPLDEVLRRLAHARGRLMAWLEALPDDRFGRTAIHPTFGEMPIERWLEFFLLHEAHHLYVAMIRLGEAAALGD